MNSDNDSHETAAVTYKDFLAQLGPIDKLLGSVSYSDIDSGDGKSQLQQQHQQQQPVRASARVFKKMKFDQNLTTSNISGTTATTALITTPTTITTTTTNSTTPTNTPTTNITNCSNNSANNNSTNNTTNTVNVNVNLLNDKKDDDNNKQETIITKTEINKKTVNTQWSFEEKNMFFEALNEYGKDFENIHIYMLTRLKKKGIPDEHIKTKHQIRHFYYKTSSSFLRYLKISNKVPKTAQELYALINYGELRRKIGSVSKKNWPKLNELINNGSVALRIKGKTIRIKTPMCRALRRLNQLDEKYDGLKLPTRVLVELRPKNMSAFLKVQSMAQNPRIKLAISLQKRLSSLISCISARWKTTDALIYDKAIIATNPTTQTYVPDQQTIKSNSLLLTPLLRVTPIENASIELPSIDISEYFTGQSICLNAFEARKVIKTKEDEIKKDTEKELEKSTNKSTIATTINDTDDCIKDDKIKISVDKVVDDAVNIILSLKDNKCDNKDSEIITIDDDIDAGADDDDNNCNNNNNNNDNYEYDSVVNNNNHNSNNREEKLKRIEEIKRGWTLENCGSVTIGELYLMFGSGSKLILEYTWDDLPQLKQERKDDEEILGKSIDNSITQSLKKLLSLAKLQYNHCNHANITNIGSSTIIPTVTTTTIAVTITPIPIITTTTITTSTISSVTTEKCTCGHNCCGNSGGKNHIQFKKPITSKVIKKNQTYHEVQHNLIEEKCSNEQNETQQIVEDETSIQSPNNPVVNLFTQFDIQRLNPLNRNKRRPRSKQWVVERKLVPNKSENKHQIVSMDIVPQEQTVDVNKSIGIQNNETPNISQNNINNTSDNTAILNDNNRSLNFLDPNQSNSGLSTGSLSEFLKTGDDQWISNDVGDFSLSSLLGRLDYQKTNQSLLSNNDTRLSTDVDAQLHTMLIENSIDYTEKFADLAAQVTDKK